VTVADTCSDRQVRATEQANVSAKQKFEEYVSSESKNENQTRIQDDQTRNSQGCVDGRDKVSGCESSLITQPKQEKPW
jgi:type IV secretory pathway VirB9-like protein